MQLSPQRVLQDDPNWTLLSPPSTRVARTRSCRPTRSESFASVRTTANAVYYTIQWGSGVHARLRDLGSSKRFGSNAWTMRAGLPATTVNAATSVTTTA